MKFLKTVLTLLLALAVGALLLRAFFFSGPVVARSEWPTEDILDMHVHVAGLGGKGSGCYVSASLRDSFRFDYYLRAFGVTREGLESKGDAIVFEKLSRELRNSRYVGRAIVLALDGVIDAQGRLNLSQTEVYVPNHFVAEETKKYDNLYFGASINPYRSDALNQLAQVKQQGAKLIKWIPSIQLIDPKDPRLKAFYQKMLALDLPLLTHTGQERSFSKARDELADPLRLEFPLEIGLTVIAAHVATTGENDGEDNILRLLPMFDKYPNLYADISSLTQINKLGYLNRILGLPKLKGRLLYGSDFPLINTALVSPYYFPLNLTFAEMRSIAKISNLWDRDVALKHALGAPSGLFEQSGQLLR